MNTLVLHTSDESQTDALGAALAEVLPDGTVVALRGTLGAGKTRLVQAIAAASGIDRRDVTSPTFMLVQEYQGRRTIYHLDAYRLNSLDEFLDLGVEEYFQSDGLTLIEWADRVEACLPENRLDVRIEVVGDTIRCFELVAHDERCAAALEVLANKDLVSSLANKVGISSVQRHGPNLGPG